jgi:hypothetical protein
LVVIVDDHRHVVRRHPVVATEDDVVGGPRHLAVQPVDDRDGLPVGEQPQGGRPARRGALGDLRRRELAAGAGVRARRGVGGGARLADLAAAAEARVGEASAPPAPRGPPRGRPAGPTAGRSHHPSPGRGPAGRRAGPPRAPRSSSSDRGPRCAAGTGHRRRGRRARPASPSGGCRGGAPPVGLGANLPVAIRRSSHPRGVWRDLWGIRHCCQRPRG